MSKKYSILACFGLCLTVLLFTSCLPLGNEQPKVPAQPTLQEKADSGLTDFSGITGIGTLYLTRDNTTIKNITDPEAILVVTGKDVILENVTVKEVTVMGKKTGRNVRAASSPDSDCGKFKLKDCLIGKIDISSAKAKLELSGTTTVSSNLTVFSATVSLTISDTSAIKADLVISSETATIKLQGEAKVENNLIVTEGSATITGEESTVVAGLEIAAEVETVAIGGGKIDSVTVAAAAEAVITITEDITINAVAEGSATIVTGDTVTIEGEAKAKVEEVAVTVTRVELKQDATVITEYEQYADFDFTGLKALVTYSNGTDRVVTMNDTNTVIDGFTTSTPTEEGESRSVTFTFQGVPVDGSVTYTVHETGSDYKEFLNNALEDLANGRYDEGIAKIEAAYGKVKNNETKAYYAIAKLAQLSTAERVQNIIRNRFGLYHYPGTMNALLDPAWLSESQIAAYTEYYDYDVYSYDTDNSLIGTIRVSGTPVYESEGYYNGNILVYIPQQNIWVGTWDYTNTFHLSENRIKNLTDVVPDPNGPYLYWVDSAPESNDGEVWNKGELSDSEEYTYLGQTFSGAFLKENVVGYRYTSNGIKSFFSGTTPMPAIKAPAWMTNSAAYKNTLITEGGTVYQSMISWTYLLAAAAIDGNANGFNQIIDEFVDLLDTDYEAIKEIAEGIEDKSVQFDAEALSVLGLTPFFGDEPLVVGGAELRVIFSAMDVLKGVFQFFASYDWSFNMNNLKQLLLDAQLVNGGQLSMSEIEAVCNLFTENTLKTRKTYLLNQSKKSITSGLTGILASYDYLMDDEITYIPDAVKETISQMGAMYVELCSQIIDAIENDGSVEIPYTDTYYSGGNVIHKEEILTVNVGKLFSPSRFYDFLDRNDDGSLKLYTVAEVVCVERTSGSSSSGYRKTILLENVDSSDEAAVKAAIEAQMSKFLEKPNNPYLYDYILGYGIKENIQMLSDIFSLSSVTENDDYSLLSFVHVSNEWITSFWSTQWSELDKIPYPETAEKD